MKKLTLSSVSRPKGMQVSTGIKSGLTLKMGDPMGGLQKLNMIPGKMGDMMGDVIGVISK